MSDVAYPLKECPDKYIELMKSKGLGNKVMISAWGALGDVACSEPAVRAAIKIFKNKELTLATPYPDIFRHLHQHFKQVIDPVTAEANQDSFLVRQTQWPMKTNAGQFMGPMLMQPVEYACQCLLSQQLDVMDRTIRVEPNETIIPDLLKKPRRILLHPGGKEVVKAVPPWWWHEHITALVDAGETPVIIGTQTVDGFSTYGCEDLRGQTTLNELIYLLKNCAVLMTNDSSPMHIASAGRAFINFITTIKRPDFLKHWRYGMWGWRMYCLNKCDGLWAYINTSPLDDDVFADKLPKGLMERLLPDPVEAAKRVIEQANHYALHEFELKPKEDTNEK